MNQFEEKLKQIKLQFEISEIVRQDNGAFCVFDYHINPVSELQTVGLNLLTYKEGHNDYMLLKSFSGSCTISCLEQAKAFLEQLHLGNEKHSYTLKWRKKSNDAWNESHFFVKNQEEALKLFLHEKDAELYDIEIIENPIA